jgi:alkaline phosphatase
MIEGGAVDWAGHGNNLPRMIEEQIDFNNSVQAAVDWVEDNSDWDETLLIVTADHETGYLLGPGGFEYTDVDSNGEYTDDDILLGYKHVEDNGAGNLPGVEWFSGGHTNQIVPLFAKGAGAELFEQYIDGTDPNLAGYYGLDGQIWDGDYIDNTGIYSVMMEASEVPEPATMALLGLGGLVIARRRRRSA